MSWRARRPDPAGTGGPTGVPLGELAEHLGGELVGDPRVVVSAVRSPEHAGPGDVAVLLSADSRMVAASRAAAFVVNGVVGLEGRPHVRVGDPRRALAELIDLLHPLPPLRPGVHPHATVAASASIDPTSWVGPGARVGERVRLAARVEIHANAVLGDDCEIGEDSVIHPNVTLYPGTRVGARVDIQSGTVIGAAGFGLLRRPEGGQREIPQIGVVVIEDDVSIGANCAIDRATLHTTRIGRGTKIDNLVQIGHNSMVGEDCCIVAQAGIAGSVNIGDRCVLLAQAGVKDHVTLADDVYLGAQAGAAGNLSSGEWLGTPALPVALARRVLVGLSRLPDLLREVRALRRRLRGTSGPEVEEPRDPDRS
jgi:UDP-3-O-[3-hydroxymyristoyl] glucosamine N-acyltransferase